MVDNVLTLICVSENSGAEISHLLAPTSQTDTNVCTQYPNSFSIDPAHSIHQNTTATLYPQPQVTHFAAYRPWQPSNNYSRTLASSLLRVTHYGCYTQHPQPPLVQVPFSPVFYPSHPHSSVEQNLPTSQADANWSSTLQVHSRNVRYVSPHPAIQQLEAKLRGTTGETA